MGCCVSIEEGNTADKLRNASIDNNLRMEKLNNQNEVKLLLLGKKEKKKKRGALFFFLSDSR